MSTQIREFIVNRQNFSKAQWIDRTAELEDGQVVSEIEKFALTANNITYAVAGDMLNYWAFFPAQEGWGKIPVWGFARVVQSKCPQVAVGDRVFGYLPMANYLVMQPERINAGSFLDLYKQRRDLHPVYNNYMRITGPRAHEDLEPILRPLFTTSFLIDDWLADNDFFGAKQVISISASSKTGLGLGFGLSRRSAAPAAIGLTSKGNKAFVESTGYFDKTVTYDDVTSLDASIPTAVVDFAGNGEVLSAVHHHFRDNLVESTTVGLSHKDAPRATGNLPGAKPHLFFAPDQMKKRNEEWGNEAYDRKVGEGWDAFATSAGKWMKLERSRGEAAITKVYSDMLSGRINPAEGHLLSLG